MNHEPSEGERMHMHMHMHMLPGILHKFLKVWETRSPSSLAAAGKNLKRAILRGF